MQFGSHRSLRPCPRRRMFFAVRRGSLGCLPLLLLWMLEGCGGRSDGPGGGGSGGHAGMTSGAGGTSSGRGGMTPGTGGGSGAGAANGGAGGQDCYPLRAIPIDATGEWCVAGYEQEHRQVVGCNPERGCSDDYECMRRKSDGALFIAFGTSCFERDGSWERCVPRADDLPLCGEGGMSGNGGQAGAAGEDGR
jgi:hypothetical protein